MSFVSGSSQAPGGGGQDAWGIGGKEVRGVVEGLIRKIWKEIKGVDVEEIRVMPYQIAMDVVSHKDGSRPDSADPSQYGSDKPDTRFQNYVRMICLIYFGLKPVSLAGRRIGTGFRNSIAPTDSSLDPSYRILPLAKRQRH